MLPARGLHQTLQVEHQLAPVAESGEGVGGRLLAAHAQHLHVLRMRQRQAAEYSDQTEGGEHLSEQVERAGAPNQDADRHQREHDREDDLAPASLFLALGSRNRLPDRPGHHDGGQRPARIHQAARLVGLRGVLQQVEAVADRERDQSGADPYPGAVNPPARDRQRAHDERQEDDVRERVGEVCGHLEGLATYVVEHRLEDDCRGDRGHCQAADGAVQQETAIDVLDAGAQKEADGRVHGQVEEEVAHIRGGWDRDLLEVPEDAPVVEVAGGPGGERQAEEQRDDALLWDKGGPCKAGGCSAVDQRQRDPAFESGLERTGVEAGQQPGHPQGSRQHEQCEARTQPAPVVEALHDLLIGRSRAHHEPRTAPIRLRWVLTHANMCSHHGHMRPLSPVRAIGGTGGSRDAPLGACRPGSRGGPRAERGGGVRAGGGVRGGAGDARGGGACPLPGAEARAARPARARVGSGTRCSTASRESGQRWSQIVRAWPRLRPPVSRASTAVTSRA